MLRLTFLTLFLLVSSSSSTSMIKKSLSRRNTDTTPCQAIYDFDCKCSSYRVTCTTENDLPSSLTIAPNEQQKYQSVEIVVSAKSDISVNEYTFAPVKQLFKPDSGNVDFRIKFEKFTGLQLTSPGIFNRVFPDNLPADARKHVALEIYNPEVQPNDNVNLFQNINVDSLELYALYPFRGSFQQLFNGANINYLRLSGGDIRSDPSQSFTGNIQRLELAKQASALSVQNFPVYPVHDLTINAFYISEFNDPHPPNYNNLGELRVHSPGQIPANAFQNFPNIHTLSLSADQGIDPQALNGLKNLEKLIIRDAAPSLDLINSLPNLKEFEGSIEKLDANGQCQLLEKLANGQLAVQAIPNGHQCTCVSAYLDTAAGRGACDAQGCDQSSCAAIKNNYNAETRTFNAPPAILRADGSNAFYPRPARPHSSAPQISNQDQQKLHEGIPQQQQQHDGHSSGQHPSQDTHDQGYNPQYPSYDQGYNPQYPSQDHQSGDNDQYNQNNVSPAPQSNSNDEVDFDYDHPQENNPQPALPSEPQSSGTNQNDADFDYDAPGSDKIPNQNPSSNNNENEPFNYDEQPDQTALTTDAPFESDSDDTTTVSNFPKDDDEGEDQGSQDGNQGDDGEDGSDVNDPNATLAPAYYPDENELNDNNGTDISEPGKKKTMSWLPIIIIAAAMIGLLLIGLVVLLIRKNRAKQGGYAPTSTNDGAGTQH